MNISTLPAAEVAVRDIVLEYLTTSPDVTNPTVRNLCKKDYRSERNGSIRELLKMEPFFPALAHEIYKSSNVGLL